MPSALEQLGPLAALLLTADFSGNEVRMTSAMRTALMLLIALSAVAVTFPEASVAVREAGE